MSDFSWADTLAALVVSLVEADLLLILTDVDAVYADWGTPQQRPLPRLTIEEAVQMDREGAFGEGSMAPKIRAAVDFCLKNLQWTSEDGGEEGPEHEWIVLRTGSHEAFARPFADFVEF